MFEQIVMTTATHSEGLWSSGFGFVFLLVPVLCPGVLLVPFGMIGRCWRRTGWSGGDGRALWSRGGGTPEHTLGERFAQGDIDGIEYHSRLKVLRANSLPTQTKRSGR